MFDRLFHYNYDTNQQLIRYLDDQQIRHTQMMSWLSHILNAHHIWIARLKKEASPYAVWQEHPPQEFSGLNQQAWEATRDFLSGSPDLSQLLVYQNSKGITFRSRMDDILWHVLNHSTHHRAQISTLIRQSDHTPPPMDYIFYQRES